MDWLPATMDVPVWLLATHTARAGRDARYCGRPDG